MRTAIVGTAWLDYPDDPCPQRMANVFARKEV